MWWWCQAYKALKDLHGRALDADVFMRATLAQVVVMIIILTMMARGGDHDHNTHNDGKRW